MLSLAWARVGVFYAKGDGYAPFFREVFDHAGMRVEQIEQIVRDLGRVHILVLCGNGSLDSVESAAISEWVKRGGCVVCCGGAWRLETLLGVQNPKHMSNGQLHPSKPDRLWPEGLEGARFFGGVVAKPGGCEVLAKASGEYVGLGRRRHGRGAAFFVGPHVAQTISLMQMGRSVECDSIGPADGSAQLDNNNLRAEDGTVLDYTADRSTVEGCDTPFFALPHADAVRELLLRCIVQAAEIKGVSLPLLWYWPHAAKAAAMLTLDCEKSDREYVEKLYRVLAMFGVPATWMVGMPGYPIDVYRAMRGWEHEIGLLFHTDDHHGWHDEKFKIQHTAVGRLAAEPNLLTVRPIDGKWKGYTSLYEICDQTLARVSLSKGGRQPGTSGFLFGTCHPFFPMKRDGHAFMTQEIPYCTYMPGAVTPDPVAEDLLAKTVARNGCYHMVLRPEAVADASQNASLRRLLSLCKQSRVEFLLPGAYHNFEKARRQMRVGQKLIGEEGMLSLVSENPVDGLTVLFSGPSVDVQLRGRDMDVRQMQVFGTTFYYVQVNLEAKQQIEMSVRRTSISEAA